MIQGYDRGTVSEVQYAGCCILCYFFRTNNNYLYELEVKWWSLLDLVNSVDLGSDIHG